MSGALNPNAAISFAALDDKGALFDDDAAATHGVQLLVSQLVRSLLEPCRLVGALAHGSSQLVGPEGGLLYLSVGQSGWFTPRRTLRATDPPATVQPKRLAGALMRRRAFIALLGAAWLLAATRAFAGAAGDWLHQSPDQDAGPGWRVVPYRTFDELRRLMEQHLRRDRLDAVIHCAAVSDYLAGGIFAPAPGTNFRPDDGTWAADSGPPTLADRAAGKVKSDEPELWLRLVRAPKLVDLVRTEWGFRGVLVKFKLEVGVSDERLLEIAERSRRHSDADLMAANTLEGAQEYAFLGPLDGGYQRVARSELAARLIAAVERMAREREHG